MEKERSIEMWEQSADAWIADQGEKGDWSRRAILDPALEQSLQQLKGKRVLDLGCGEGRYSRVLKARGAIVTGVDPVAQFIDRARSLDSGSCYYQAVAECLPFDYDSFDMVLSYLSIIDIPDLEQASKEIARVLCVGGELVIVNISNLASTTPGWIKDEAGNKLHRIVDNYMQHFSMGLEWRDIKIRNYHRPLSFVLELFLGRGFVLTEFVEPLPDPTDPDYPDEFRAPNFQIYKLKRCE